MIIKKLILKNFRNHKYLDIDFKIGINAITGPNAVGKTNIVEAVDYLSLARSFRNVDDEDLLKDDCDFPAEIFAVIEEGNITRKINVKISKTARFIQINGKPVSKLSELSKVVNTVLFEPKDAMLFKGSPRERRMFLDVNLSKRHVSYFDNLSQYEKLLKKRNDLLKEEKPNEDLLDTITEMMVKTSHQIIDFRENYVKDINDILIKIARALAIKGFKIELLYKPFVANDSNFETTAKEAFKKVLESDLKHHATSIGPHREDFSMSLNGADIATFGSQGQNRLGALMLKLSPYFLIEDKDKKPIVILDDVMSELDTDHQKSLLEFLKKIQQVLITGTRININGINHYPIKKEVL